MFGHPWSGAEARDVDSLHAYYLPTSMLSMRRSSIVADSTEWFGVGGRLVLPNVHPRVLKRKAYLDVDTFLQLNFCNPITGT
ncbi:hypothetical protein Pyn_11560 [Prunus yedoensis var. nudiflora]|uniref:Uncharacterized protein n=1 Tax=Prunus yedoensis var. nudiflora TaxID=2094558 RepID=A0A314Y1P3_PRUYE|nr:hypothetical protein Pyn_11560 [Prunus yedoensis var. nudiflora]